ncbi:hypothetical protein AQI88_16560 [Streptomyces cellostaticus]|uniref:Major facilitator superfamily (MFS) profile domain-containing protein n=1 Tax=Streptomyces cellostaticus TaxID=67285 RepID=A0A101NMB5_9ACTN|nr:MFS transporter [Streptomyces cellostaticus]KUM95674.1 hypothetical protein AQI88_16560 [Streptomyces cellostaticus]GHI09729.1 hypothetical protein Scel_80500 [Streptomyces cellostaticus]
MKPLDPFRALPPPARLLLAAGGVNALGSGLVAPLLVAYLHTEQGFAVSVATGAVALISVGAFIGGPLSGWVSDRCGRITAVLVALAVAAVGMVLFAVVHRPWQALLAAAVFGLGIGGNAAWNALLTGTADARQRPAVFSLNFAVMNAAIGAGGLIGGAAVHGGGLTAFRALYVADGLSFVLVALLVLVVRRSLATRQDDLEDGEEAPPGPRPPTVPVRLGGVLLVAFLLYLAGYSQLESGLSAVLVAAHGMSTADLALLFAVNTLVVVAGRALVLSAAGRRTARDALRLTALAWASFWGLTLVTWPLGQQPAAVGGLAVAMGIFAVGESFYAVGMPVLLTAVAGPRRLGSVNGLHGAATSLGYVIGPLAAGLLVDARHARTFTAAAAALCLVAALTTRLLPSTAVATSDSPGTSASDAAPAAGTGPGTPEEPSTPPVPHAPKAPDGVA